MTDKSISNILAHAADIQEAHGKCEGILMLSSGQVCLEGAIALAEGAETFQTFDGFGQRSMRMSKDGRVYGLGYDSPAVKFFTKYIQEATGIDYAQAWQYNDGLYAEDPPQCGTVVEELRRASKYADEQGV